MIDYLPFLMLPVAFVLMFLGVQVAFSMMLTAVLFGLAIFGDRVTMPNVGELAAALLSSASHESVDAADCRTNERSPFRPGRSRAPRA